jgi:hypothetical protein
LADLFCFLVLSLRSESSLAAENLFLRKQLGFYQERKIRPCRTSPPARLTLLLLSRWFNWRSALTVVTPRTFTGWHRKGFQLFWRKKCQSGRPGIPADLLRLIRKMARENPSWGQERIANELLVKLGLRVSPRTIRKYLRESPSAGNPRRDQRWSTFLKNHAEAIIACDFCVVASVTFRMLYVLVVMEHASRRVIHLNVTAHPSAAWTLQQLREAIPSDHTHRFILHASSKDFVVLATALQSRPTALFLGARPSRSGFESPHAAPTPEALFRPRKSSGGAPGIERTSPRVQPLGRCCLTVVEFLRITLGRPSELGFDRKRLMLGAAGRAFQVLVRRSPPIESDSVRA